MTAVLTSISTVLALILGLSLGLWWTRRTTTPSQTPSTPPETMVPVSLLKEALEANRELLTATQRHDQETLSQVSSMVSRIVSPPPEPASVPELRMANEVPQWERVRHPAEMRDQMDLDLPMGWTTTPVSPPVGNGPSPPPPEHERTGLGGMIDSGWDPGPVPI
jgi:hypothetical protein